MNPLECIHSRVEACCTRPASGGRSRMFALVVCEHSSARRCERRALKAGMLLPPRQDLPRAARRAAEARYVNVMQSDAD